VLLEGAGYEPTAVSSVHRALAKLESDGADLVLTDLVMPLRDGLDLLGELHDRADAPPAVLVTGSSEPVLLERARELGAVDILGKPFSPERLRRVVASALASHAVAA
jgi:CheY-like chemotaxis protein